MLNSTLNPHSTDSNEESNRHHHHDHDHHHHPDNNNCYPHSPLIPPSLPLFTSSIINKQHKHKLNMKLWIKQLKHYLRCMDYKRYNDIRLRKYLQTLIMFDHPVTSTSSTSSTSTSSTLTLTSSTNRTLSKLKKISKMKIYFTKYNNYNHLRIRSKLKIDPNHNDRENHRKQIDDLELCRTINIKENFDETMKKSTNQFRNLCYIID
ncbi:unnamed protein product [Schistosoma curassoni]|uniref:BESS domain-containing protein n=1 Tax=Schistosoma curassoni TaxID=6186 RepID=A0A183JGR3_9TREM|nr:unnamed protein product [Schistosoma curassoni]